MLNEQSEISFEQMSYSNDYSFCYSSGEDSFSYVSDSSFYCPVHYLPPPPCPIHQPYPIYFQIATPQQQQYQVSNSILSSPSFQVHPIKKSNRRFTEDQIHILEEHFNKVNKYLSKETIDELSTRTQLKPSQIRVWFNNKRTREHR
jgi:hypothetical protein